MAPSQKLFPFLFFFFFIFVSLSFTHTHARDSRFFSKFTNNNENSNHDQNPSSTLPETTQNTISQDQDPSFVRETGNAYGLYGHDESRQIPSYTANNNNNNNETFKDTRLTQTQESSGYENYPNNMNNNDNVNENFYYNSDAYGHREKQRSGGSEFRERGYNSKNYNNGVETQGMSDTRFMENGKYFYPVENEKKNTNYDPDQYTNNNEEYSGKNNRNSYNSNAEAYQNQQENFEEEEEELEP